MKKIIFMVIALSFALVTYADDIPESAVPVNIKNYVTENYPFARNISWEYNKKSNSYEAEFYIDGREVDLEISSAGVLMNSTEDMIIRDIPIAIASNIRSEYPDAEIMGAKKIVDGQSVSYDIRLTIINNNGSTRNRNILYDGNGNIIKK